MEAQFTVRDTLQNFANWVNDYGMTKQADFIPQTVWHLVTGRYLEHPVESKGLIRFTFDIAEPERLEVTAVTRIEFDTATKQWNTEDAELNAYFAELVRAIRLKWGTISLTVTELREQSFRRLEAGEEPIDVFRNFYLPNLPEGEQPKDASEAYYVHKAWKSAMSARRKKRKQGKG